MIRFLNVQRYLNFLSLKQNFPEENLVPPPDVRILWYAHMWQSEKYQIFCRRYFGGIIDHTFENSHGDSSETQKKNGRFLFLGVMFGN